MLNQISSRPSTGCWNLLSCIVQKCWWFMIFRPKFSNLRL
jgi:hypothetical protein